LIDPCKYFEPALKLIKLTKHSWPKGGPTVFEVGTGRTVNAPLAFWLSGAREVITYDLNNYLVDELITESIEQLKGNRLIYEEMFHKYGIQLIEERWQNLLSSKSNTDVFKMANINYVSPGDASRTGLPTSTIDMHTSINVLEHIPHPDLIGILIEAYRITKPSGILAHQIDPSDHFSHSDKRLSSINFLKYDDNNWKNLAGNKFMFQNRLRASEYIELFNNTNFELLSSDPTVSEEAINTLNSGFMIDTKLKNSQKKT